MKKGSRRTVFALTRVALDHLVACLEAGEGHIGDRVLLMVSLVGRDDGSIGGQREVNTREARKKKRMNRSSDIKNP